MTNGFVGRTLSWREARLRAVRATRAVSSDPEHTAVAQCRLLSRTRRAPDRDAHGAHEGADRFGRRARRSTGERFATVEPVFANVRHNKRLDRFTLRGRAKVDGQWKLYCLVHNIEKLAARVRRGVRAADTTRPRASPR